MKLSFIQLLAVALICVVALPIALGQVCGGYLTRYWEKRKKQ